MGRVPGGPVRGRRFTDPASPERPAFWAKQGIRLAVAVLLLFGLLSIWFEIVGLPPVRVDTGVPRPAPG